MMGRIIRIAIASASFGAPRPLSYATIASERPHAVAKYRA